MKNQKARIELRPGKIVQVLADRGRPLGTKELLSALHLPGEQQHALSTVLNGLLREKKITRQGKRYSAAAPPSGSSGRASSSSGVKRQVATGILKKHRDGFGFVQVAGEENEDVFLPPAEAAKALDGDRLEVEVQQIGRNRTSGKVLKVLTRIRERVIGTYREQGKKAYVTPLDSQFPEDIWVPRTQLARPGDCVKVVLGVGKDLITGERLVGEVVGTLGQAGNPSSEVLSVAYSQGFSDEFPEEVMRQADAILLKVDPVEALKEGRKDLRSLPLVTIDGIDARDFDDAVCVEETGQSFRLFVAIADVAHYVGEGTALDEEAYRRATSVYLPNRVLPMLPERLSNGICSLKPDEDRLCLVAELIIDRSGHTKSAKIYPGLMRSAARCTYEEVQAGLEGKDVPGKAHLKPLFDALSGVSKTLRAMRDRRGSIDFDVSEIRPVIGPDERPLKMEKRERIDSHRLVEECMLAANEAVARYFHEKGLPTVNRFHGEPDPDKLAAFVALAGAHGFFFEEGKKISSLELNRLIQKLRGHPQNAALNQLLLRSMMQALYSSDHVGHYGLAAEHYLHFTSPIRRYPDLLVHRLLAADWTRRKIKKENHLEEMALHSSERERAAIQIEREVTSYYAAELMKDRIGEQFTARVTSVADFGFFIQVDNEWVEGLVKLETLGEPSKLDRPTHSIELSTSGKHIRLGDSLQVELIDVSIARRQLEFKRIDSSLPVRNTRLTKP